MERRVLHGLTLLMNMGIMLELRILTIVGILENCKKENGALSVRLSSKTVELEPVVGTEVNVFL